MGSIILAYTKQNKHNESFINTSSSYEINKYCFIQLSVAQNNNYFIQ